MPSLSTEIFIPFYSSHSCSCNAYNFVSNGAILAELFTNYYASRAWASTRHQNQPFLEKKTVRALSSSNCCKNIPMSTVLPWETSDEQLSRCQQSSPSGTNVTYQTVHPDRGGISSYCLAYKQYSNIVMRMWGFFLWHYIWGVAYREKRDVLPISYVTTLPFIYHIWELIHIL